MAPKHYKINRRVEISKISGVSLSSLQDGFFVVHVAGEYDYVFQSNKKTEIVSILAETFKGLTSNTLNVTFSNNIAFKTKDHSANIVVSKDPSGTDEPKVKINGANIEVTVGPGLPAEALTLRP
eukprot:GFYU01033825.1.p1 GENE.GFYU01033825.1~~GFYU01033825.1.p1  ORF type:complete len:143 (+),score=42.50 GFYU01033825.1:60-431(+)